MATQTRVPTGVGAVDTWTGSPETVNKHLNVDEGTGSHDSDTSYNERAASAGGQQYTFAAFDLGTITAINSVAVVVVGREAGIGGTQNIVPRIVVNGTIYTGTPVDPGGSYVTITETWLTNPDTGLDWEQADVEGTGANPLEEFGHGVSGIGAGEILRVTAADLVCDYDEAAGGLSIPIAAYHYNHHLGSMQS
jgi:hypothetical protein